MPFDGSFPVCIRNYPDSCYLLVGLSSLIHQLQLKEVQNETPSQIEIMIERSMFLFCFS